MSLFLLHLLLCWFFQLFFSPWSYSLMDINLYLPLFHFTYLFFLSFLSPHHICQFCFHCFIPHLAPCFSFVFQFVLQLVLFLTGKYNFLFALFSRSIYCIFVELFSCCSWVYIYMCIFHLNYHLPNLVSAICLGFIFGFSFWIFLLLSLNAVTNHFWNLLS